MWDQFQMAKVIHVPCGQMVGSSVLERIHMGSVMCQQMWDQS